MRFDAICVRPSFHFLSLSLFFSTRPLKGLIAGYRYPENARSKVWEYFGFYQVKEGPKTKENLDMTKVICRLCRKQYANKGLWHMYFVDFVSVSLELLQCNVELNNMHSLSLLNLQHV